MRSAPKDDDDNNHSISKGTKLVLLVQYKAFAQEKAMRHHKSLREPYFIFNFTFLSQ